MANTTLKNNTSGKSNLRIGNGFDSHSFELGRKLIIGGVHIPYEKGLKGHSDGDVLTHAVIDSLLGAAGLGDIGEFFPPSDASLKGVNSISLLEQIIEKIKSENWSIVNLDCVLICEEPKISPYKKQILDSLSEALQIEFGQINLKGKTAEKMGSLGRGEGIAAIVVSLLEKHKSVAAE
ncbi:MAG: 2-C-methyl-D-erythritol 2,4-cyclodiphosphate synthase [Candidatus Caenarcaniphilales bacterium]|nr:2-C-methyl-D-erythritol 2,4-cyclodiphosphate synthase [Candidatus Caenarcaniphilales bacterium]